MWFYKRPMRFLYRESKPGCHKVTAPEPWALCCKFTFTFLQWMLARRRVQRKKRKGWVCFTTPVSEQWIKQGGWSKFRIQISSSLLNKSPLTKRVLIQGTVCSPERSVWERDSNALKRDYQINQYLCDYALEECRLNAITLETTVILPSNRLWRRLSPT